ncbi:hypothetical protein TNCV_4367531 [Trichonephila clavipes]|nr:hypothetical protein TNCV_4367531 [Trichonephila clavipes]
MEGTHRSNRPSLGPRRVKNRTLRLQQSWRHLSTSSSQAVRHMTGLRWRSREKYGRGILEVKISDHGRHVMISSPVPLKTRREGARCTLNLSRAQTSSRWVGIEVGITFQDGDRFYSCQVIYSQFGLAIHQNDHQARRRFVEWAQNEIAVVPDFHKRILFSDEAYFSFNGYVNKQNCRIWSEANPQVYVETPLHPEKLTVWCALWAGGILLQKR